MPALPAVTIGASTLRWSTELVQLPRVGGTGAERSLVETVGSRDQGSIMRQIVDEI